MNGKPKLEMRNAKLGLANFDFRISHFALQSQ